MRLYIILLPLTIMLITTYAQASTPEELSEIMSSAKQLYKEGDYKRAISLYEQAYALGSPKAMLNLSSFYSIGKGVTKDENLADRYLQEAIKEYKVLANNDDGDAQFNLGNIYNYRTRPPKKLEAYNWYLKAANNNHMKAQYAVARALDAGSLDPEVKKDSKEAIKWFEKSAKQGHKPAIEALAKYKEIQPDPESSKRVNILWSTKEKCFEEGAFTIAIETYGNTYKVAACAKYGCRIAINEFGKKAHKGDFRDDPKFVWHSDKEFETRINGDNMRFYHCLTK